MRNSGSLSKLACLGVACLTASLLIVSCGGGGGGGGGTTPPVVTPPTPPPPETPLLSLFQDMPGVKVTITGLTGGTGPNGAFRSGDTVSVHYTLAKRGGAKLKVTDLNYGGIMISGPTSNYQVVVGRQTDLIARSVENTDGSYTYTFPVTLPTTFQAPLNDTSNFTDGEMTGQPLTSGTYTVGIETYKLYQVEQTTYRDPDSVAYDFLFGNATTIEHRELVKIENCDQCHSQLRAHGEFRRNINTCLLCHTSGAEDRNVATVENGTPNVTIDFRVMIHKLHNGAHLPSVLGIATNQDGSRNYAAAPAPYKIVGFNNSVTDFSDVSFPVWPSLSFAMPRNFGYSPLTTAQKALDDNVRKGVVACDKCHGDPDGSGPLTAPAQGASVYDAPSRRACGSCHDDIDWAKPYTQNLLSMPAQADDASCTQCHNSTNALLDTREVHIHPMKNPAINTGFHINLTNVVEAGTNNGNGKIDIGEKVAVIFTMTDDNGNNVAPGALGTTSVSCVLNGPTNNRNIINNYSIPTAALGAGPTYTTTIPEYVQLELVGTSTGVTDTFGAARLPMWNVGTFVPTVRVRTATAAGTTMTGAGVPRQNYIDVASTAGFVRDGYIVVEDTVAGKEEYLRVQSIIGNRLWFNNHGGTSYQPSLRYSHNVGATVAPITLSTKVVTTDYTVNAGAAQITEVTEFGAGRKVLISYYTDFVMPATYPNALDESQDMLEYAGAWVGKPIVSGTYTISLWSYRTLTVNANGETQTYRSTNNPATFNFLVTGSVNPVGGAPTAVEPVMLVSSFDTCNSCHDDVLFHGGGRRGLETCLACHGVVGFADRPVYVAPNIPATPGANVEFRWFLHRLHAGKQLEASANHHDDIALGGGGTYPDNWGYFALGEVGFPAIPDGVKNCDTCHGTSKPWLNFQDRDHPTAMVNHAQNWKIVCNSCHDTDDAGAHMDTKTTSNGAEACGVCHGTGAQYDLALYHKIR